MIKTFNDMRNELMASGQRHRIAAVCVYDKATCDALHQVEEEGIASTFFIDGETPEDAAAKGVQMIHDGKADILMKGLIGTDLLLKAILHKEKGLLPAGHVLTHISVAEMPTYHKLLFFSDAAVIPYPTHEQRIEQVRYAADICRKMGIKEPRIALIHCSEKPSPKFPFVDGYQEIKQMAEMNTFGPCLVDGPLDVKSACSLHALKAKGISSVLNGEADVLIMPDIEAGNAFYKSMTLFAGAHTAGVLCGTQCPVVVPSRGDSTEAKYNSILFALVSL